MALARRLTTSERAALLHAYLGTRGNRRHKPGRAFERTAYRFDILADYGAFRDLQRHRLLTLEWQPLSARHGYTEPAAIEEVGALGDWRAVMERSAELYESLSLGGFNDIAPYAVVMAYRVRFYMEMNAREAMHLIELRTAPQGHPSYRRICQLMHRLFATWPGTRKLPPRCSSPTIPRWNSSVSRLSARRKPSASRSAHDLAAADVVGLSGNRRRFGRREKLHQRRDFFRLNDALDRDRTDRLRSRTLRTSSLSIQRPFACRTPPSPCRPTPGRSRSR